MILVFDLDYTLLDIEKFKADKSLIFGITPEENERQGEELFKKRGLNYNPETHIEFLKNTGVIKDAKKTLEGLKNLIKNIDNYLFPGVKETLAYLKKQGYKLILITLGDLSIQKPKVENSRIKKYFDEIIFEDKDKSQNERIKDLSKTKEDILIVNDRVDQSLAMQKTLGKKAKIFLVKGPYSKDIEHKEKIHNSITELVDFCQNLS